MTYIFQLFFILLGCFIIGSSVVDMVDHYRETHPQVTIKATGTVSTPTKMFVKGTVEVVPSLTDSSIEWSGDTIKIRPRPTEAKP